MTLTIDSRNCDLNPKPIRVPGFDVRDWSDPKRCRQGRSLTLTLPATARNDRLLGFARDPHGAERFNAVRHRAELTAEGALLLGGTVRLLAAGNEGYTVEIRTGGARWAKNAARKMFREIPVEFTMLLTPTAICAGWKGSAPVRFLPVHRDEYPQRNGSTDLLPAERLLSVDDYHPFLHIATLLEALVADAGYRLESRFFETEFFRSLYLSGAYAARDTQMLRRRMDFRAGRTTAPTAVADTSGRVGANPFAAGNTVGNLFETAYPRSDDDTTGDLFDNGKCFGTELGRICFRPVTELNAGFEYYLRYTTAHRILTRDRLQGFDGIYLGRGCDIRFTLANRYADRRNSLAAAHGYRIIVFGHKAGARYRLTCTRNGISNTPWAEFAARSASVTTAASDSYAAPALQIESAGRWLPYTDDWALYDGYIEERGETTVELRVRTAPESVRPTAPKRFDTVYFYGAEEGMALTLHKECRLRPCFSARPGYGETVRFGDVARHPIRQTVLFEALQHLFNLRFLTDEVRKCLRIEPADDLYDRTRIIDWSRKTDYSKPIELRPLETQVHEVRTWSYAEGDGAAARFNSESETPLGAWSVRSDSHAAREGEQTYVNPLFCPTIDSTGHYANAPSALLPQVGDRDDATADTERFTPRIVRYCGLHPLPENERWGYPSGGDSYPLAAFHFAGDATTAGFTLCFEDRDGQQGLHRFYDRQIMQENFCEQIIISLRIEPGEFEALFDSTAEGAHADSVFRLDAGGETLLATLERIESYDPEAASTRCTFTRIPED